MTDGGILLGLLAEDERLRAFAAVVLGSRTTPEAAERSGLAPRDAVRALHRLEAGGLVSGDDRGWVAHPELFKDAARAAAPAPSTEDYGEPDTGRAGVLRRFLHDGRLTQIPTARGKRLVVLDHVVQVFEPGVRYAEREVNAYLRAFHPDVAALRRYLVDEHLLSREGGEYWRSGGTVSV